MMPRHVLVAPALALLLSLSACAGGTSASGGPVPADTAALATPTAGDFVGDWAVELVTATSGQRARTGDDLRQQGGNLTLEVRADGTFVLAGTGAGFPDPVEGTWAVTSGATATFTAGGSGLEATLADDRLTLDGLSHIFVFAKS